MKRLAVYCGSSPGSDPAFAEAARAIGVEMARRGIGLVYGGGRLGLMGVVADTVIDNGGEAYGVIPQALIDLEVAHTGLTELHIVTSMHERKAKMTELTDAFVALPGGIGTLEELIEVYTWSYLGIHDKPLGLVNTNGYYDGFTDFLDHSVTQGFLRPETRASLVAAPEPETLLDALVRART
jgi:uncharacterized protein (TIGR00730 family)